MKQYITIEQLKELTEEELIILNSLHFNPYLQRIAHPEFHTHTKQDWVEATCKINIGTMIEMIESYTPQIEKGRDWTVEIIKGCISAPQFIRKQNTELCDSLWERIKNII